MSQCPATAQVGVLSPDVNALIMKKRCYFNDAGGHSGLFHQDIFETKAV